MSTASSKIDDMSKKIAERQAEATAIGAIYKFVLDGEGGGTWVLNLKDNPGITPGDGAAQCTIKMSASDFLDMVEGRVPGEQLFFMNKLRVEGDVSLALKLQALMKILK
jgi:putative sterol carrier protein